MGAVEEPCAFTRAIGGRTVARSEAKTVEGYLRELPDDRREVVAKVRDVILANLPPGYQETMNWGMIAYEVPLERYPETYNGQPLIYMALAAQKNHFAVYASGVYMDPQGEAWVQTAFERAGKKLDMGKSCIRFRKLENIPLEVIGEVAAKQPLEDFIAQYEASRKR
jgi:uncharacterized protein YdhG (YjbR/CyaY superfamily)